MWVFLGIAFIVLFFVPESPRFYAIRGKHEIAKKKMYTIFGGIEGYDVEYEYQIILKEIEDGKALTKKQSDANLLDCFRGTNLVSMANRFVWVVADRGSAPHDHFGNALHVSVVDRISGSLQLHVVFLPARGISPALHRYRSR